MTRGIGLNLSDGLRLAKLSLTREASLDGQRIKDWFSPRFFATEFWLLWSTLMGSLPQHTMIEFRRYLNRFVYLFPDLSTMANVLRSQFNQHEAFVEPLVAWLERGAGELLEGRLRQRHRVHQITWPHDRQSTQIRTRRRFDVGRRRLERHRVRDHRLASRRSLGWNDGHATGAAA